MSLVDELRRCGFTPSVAWTLAWCGVIGEVDDLRAEPWLDTPDGPGLRSRLLMAKNAGTKLIHQVEAFREHGDASAKAGAAIKVAVELDPNTAAALDGWIASQPKPVSRPEAIRAILTAGLQILTITTNEATR